MLDAISKAEDSMELRQIRCFEAVARHLHFTRAAQELYLSQPGLSLQIQNLETELGVQLFNRTTRSVLLTDAGRAFLPSARRILADILEAEARLRDVAQLQVGRVAIGTQQSLNASGVLPNVLVDFRTRYPGVDVELREESTEHVLTMLLDGNLDLALIQLDNHDDTTDLKVERLYEEGLVFAVSQNSPLVRKGSVPFASLANEPFIVFSETARLRRLFEQACANSGFSPRIAFESGALGSIRALASAGLGIALLPLPTVETTGPPLSILHTNTRLARTISLVRRTHRYDSVAARTLASLIRRRLQASSEEACT